MDTKDLVTRLQSGESIDDIAKEMTEALNAAKREHERLVAEEAAKREAEQAAAMKYADAAQICTLVEKFIAKYYPEVENAKEITADELIEICDTLVEFFGYAKRIEKKIAPAVAKGSDDFDDAIEDFLNKFVR